MSSPSPSPIEALCTIVLVPVAIVSLPFALLIGLPLRVWEQMQWWQMMRILSRTMQRAKWVTAGHVRFFAYIRARWIRDHRFIMSYNPVVPWIDDPMYIYTERAKEIIRDSLVPPPLTADGTCLGFLAWNIGGMLCAGNLNLCTKASFLVHRRASTGREMDIGYLPALENCPRPDAACCARAILGMLCERKTRLLLRPLMRVRRRLFRARCVARRWADRRWDPNTGPGMLRLRISYEEAVQKETLNV